MSFTTRSPATDVRVVSLTAVLLCAFASGPAVAQPSNAASSSTASIMTPSSHITRYVPDARLAGEGKLTWLGFHVYDARLYASPRFNISDPFAQPFVLELTYARKLDGKGIADASRDEMQRMGFGVEAQHAKWLTQMAALFPDVDKGSRIAGVFQPGAGARFYVDGNFAGSIDEPEFSRAFFSIWLDQRTRAPRLRESLLKGSGATAGLTTP